MAPSTVSGPDADDSYTSVLAAAAAYRSCWEQREPDEYLLAAQTWSFAIAAPELSHVIAGVSQISAADEPATTVSTRARTGEVTPERPRLPTVEDAFVRIGALASRHPDSITVAFDEELCHPRTIRVDPAIDATDDEVGYEYTVIPAGRDDVSLATVASATVAGDRYRIELTDGMIFTDDPFMWAPCRDQTRPPCAGLIVKDAGGDIVYSVAAVPDRSTGLWRLPTFGAIAVEPDRLVLWEGVRVELEPAFGPLIVGDQTVCQSFVAGKTVSAEILIDPSTLRAVGYTCW